VGWYRNPPPWEETIVLFTSDAFYICDESGVDRVALAGLLGYERPRSKAEVTGVRVLTTDGSRFFRIAGSFGPAGNRRDAYSFITVLRGLIPRDRIVELAPAENGGDAIAPRK
jgi:hypothetical protein